MKKQKVTKEQEQAIFERARKEIEIGLGLKLSLIELVELRLTWTTQVVDDWQKTSKYIYEDFECSSETASRFILKNYTSDTEFIIDTFLGGIYPQRNSPEREYFKIKQDQMHLL